MSDAARAVPPPDDRVLPYTRGLSLFIAPFLLVAFVLLYLFPGDTQRLFAWTIRPTMTPMMLGAAYLGGCYFFVRALFEKRWSTLKFGFLAVTAFATLLGIATVIHWDRFNHGHVAFWLWAFLYFTAPFLVAGAWLHQPTSRVAPEPGRRPPRRRGAVGRRRRRAARPEQGLVIFVAPARMIAVWPWALTPLTCRVVGAIFCLGSAGLGVARDPRWVTARLMLKVEVLMIGLILVAAVRARIRASPPTARSPGCSSGVLTLALIGSIGLWYAHRIGPRRSTRMPLRPVGG